MLLQIILVIVSLGLLATGIIITFGLFSRKEEQDTPQISESPAPVEIIPEQTAAKSISSTVNYYEGKVSFFEKQQNTAREILAETGQSSKELPRTFAKCAVWSLLGVVIGLLFNRNIVLMAILGVGMFFIPLWQLKLYRNKYRKYLASQLESCVSLITTAYIRSGNIIQSVEENVEDLSPIVKPYFEDFLLESSVNPSIKNCVRNLRDKINNSVFKQWCETLIRTIDNSEMREALLPVTKKFSEIRIVQEQIDAETGRSIIEYIVMMAMDVSAYFLIYFANKDWWAYYYTFFGKCIMGFTGLVILFSIAKLIDVLQPVEYKI